MLDISFSEIAVIGTVALVVLGPERLPKVARTAGHLFGRLQRYVATVKSDISREMDASEMAKVKQEVEAAARGFETTMRAETSAMETEAQKLSQAIDTPLAPPAPAELSAVTSERLPIAAPTQDEIIAAQEASMSPSIQAPNSASLDGLAPDGALRFDLGIEAPRTPPQAQQTA